MAQQIVLVIHLLLAIILIGLVLVQHGKGADAGAAFGSGASGTVFGSAGTTTFLYKLTLVIAGLFALTSISLTLLSNSAARTQSLSDKLQMEQTVDTSTAVVVPEVPEN